MLTKQQVDAIKPKEKLSKVCDGDMLYIFTSPIGTKTWKVLYTFDGKKGTLTLGSYPILSIKDARLKRDGIKAQLASGINPNQQKKVEKQKKLEAITFKELLTQYMEVVTPTHKGAKQELSVIKMYIREFPRLMLKLVTEIDQLDMIEFRNERLKVVSESTVARDLGVLGGVFRYARQELRIIKSSPLMDIAKPQQAEHRDRRVWQHEIDKILKAFSYYPTFQPINKKQQTAWAFLFAIETAMRASEITGMRWENVHDDYVYLPITKNGSSRKVPLSNQAKKLLELMEGLSDENVCTLTSANTLSQYFWQVVTEKLKIDDLNFHDTRHEATTRLAQKLPIQDLAKMTGHKELKNLMRYYNPTATELAERINQ
ncbi:tyrosine-type recombinase/integrase [Acinetobacter sp. WCHAc060007]|uniref:tyrosine-type recombinase/integrase n=1 Tax=Acinetobacter sp. WCHAc060007 TaxID=2419605 RepID=UPI000EA18618|nr:site-specific integrase [Acinetobacter sp. WCHAc060007]RKG40723.1 DUF4102 domain-containing protein [Acinetobacter sp. WCHAc060007]